MNPVTKFVVHAICAAAVLCLVAHSAAAQTLYPMITPENAAQLTQVQRIGNGVPRRIVFAPDGSRLAVATTLGVWHISLPIDAPHLRIHLLDGQGGAESLAFSPDGSILAAGGDDNSVMVWDTVSDDVVTRLENHIYPVTAVAWAGHYIASGDQSGVVRIWDTATWSEYRVLTTSGTIRALAFDAADGQMVAYTDSSVITWDADTGTVISQNDQAADLGNPFEARVGERRALWSAQAGQLEIWDKNERLLAWGMDSELDNVTFSADGLPTAQPYARQPGDTPAPVTSPDGSRIATFGNDGIIRLTDSRTGAEIAALHGHIRAVTGVAFSPDGRLLASSSNDGTIQLWDATVTQDSGSLATLTGHNGGVTSVAFNADGTLLASSGYDGTIRLWGILG